MLMPSEDGYKWRGTVKRNSVIGEIFAQVEKKESSKVVTRLRVKGVTAEGKAEGKALHESSRKTLRFMRAVRVLRRRRTVDLLFTVWWLPAFVIPFLWVSVIAVTEVLRRKR